MRIWRTCAAFLTVIALVAAAPRADALISLLGIKNQMVEFLLDQLSTEGEFEITAETVEEPDDGVTAITGLKIADAKGVWLTVEALNFSWNSSRLLQGEVEFSNLAAVGIQVLRAPAVPEGEEQEALDAATPTVEDGAFEWPRSPLTLRIDRMALERVTIAEAVLGHAIAFDAEGAARDEGDVQSARLDLKRTDAVVGTISFTYARNFSDNTLAIKLDAQEAPAGLVAALADLPRDAASTLSLAADGPPTDWRVDFDLRLAELLNAGGQAAISYEGPVKVAADFSAQPGPRMAPKFAALIGDQARLQAEASEGPDGTVLIERGRLTSPHARIEASGTYTRPTGAADLALTLVAESGLAAPFDGVEFGGARFEGTVKGAPGTFAADGRLGLTALATQPVDIAEADLAVTVGQSGPDEAITTVVRVEGKTRGLRLDKISAQTIGDAETVLAASLTGDDLVLDAARIESRVLNLSAAGVLDLATDAADVSIYVTSPAIEPVAAAYGVEARGDVTLSGQAVRAGTTTNLEFEAELAGFSHAVADAKALTLSGTVRDTPEKLAFAVNGEGAALRLDRIGPDVLDQAELAINGALVGDDLQLSQLAIDAPVLTATLRGDYSLKTGIADLGYRVATPDVASVARLYDVPLFGRFAANGQASLAGREAAPQISGEVSAIGLGFDGTRYGDFDLTHDLAVSEAPAGSIDVQFRNSPYGAGRVQTGFALNQPTLTLTDLAAQALGLTARGGLEIDLDRSVAAGALDIPSASLSGLRPITGAALQGRARGRLRLTAPGGRQNASVDLTVNGLQADGVRASKATVKAALADLIGTPRVDGRVTAQKVSTGDVALDTAALTAKGPLSNLKITADVTGRTQDQPISLQAAAGVNAATSVIRASINKLTAALGEQQIRLNRPASVTLNGQVITARNLDVALPGQGLLAGDVTYYGGPMAGDVRLQAPDLAVLKDLADLPVRAGSLDVALTFDTRRSRASADGLIAGRGLVFENVDVAGTMDMDANLAWKGRTANLGATLSGDFGEPMRLTADVPMQAGGVLPALARRGPVSGSLEWTGRIDRLWALVPAPGHVLTGKAVIDLGISGDISDPTFTGGAQIKDGGYQNLDLGTILTDLALETSLSGGDLGLALSASDGANGKVTTAGRLGLDASGLELTTTLDSAVLVRRDDATARLGGGIKVAGPLNGLAVTGAVTVEEAEIRLINANPPSIVTLDDVIFKGDPPKPEEDSGGTTTLDLEINAPGRMFVRGRGLDSEWQMGLKIRGQAAAPRITGRIERVRGRLDLIGKGFDLTRGRIDFDGGEEIDPRVDVMLERRTSDLTGRIIVEGTASDPQLRFASTPALPEDEVLPRVLFGKSSQALTGSQAIQLGVGLATLMDGGAGTLDTARSAAGLDQLRIEQDEQGNASVAVGKEVAEGVWVGTKQPLGEGGTSVVVEIDVFEEVTVDAEVEQGGGSSLGVQWKRDF